LNSCISFSGTIQLRQRRLPGWQPDCNVEWGQEDTKRGNELSRWSSVTCDDAPLKVAMRSPSRSFLWPPLCWPHY